MNRSTSLLLNFGHALDHLVLLVFASAVTSIAADFGVARWEDLMPYAAGAFVMFGVGSIPAGRLGDLWGRRPMMLVFFFGTAASCALVALTQTPLQLALALSVLGAFASIYHPVGIPMLLSSAERPGMVIGWNNLAGNMGIAVAALLTGLAVKYLGWRGAFLLPAALSFLLGWLFWIKAPLETEAPSKRPRAKATVDRSAMARALVVMTVAATSGALLFNFTTNGNTELMRERLAEITSDPASLGFLLAIIYAVAAFSQVIVGSLIDRVRMKPLFLGIVVSQVLLLAVSAHAHGWWLFFLALGFMASIFAAIPFIDAVVVRYVDDQMRSRVTGIRIAIAFGISGIAVYLLGPIVKGAGFDTLLLAMAGIACITFLTVLWLPSESPPPQSSSQPG